MRWSSKIKTSSPVETKDRVIIGEYFCPYVGTDGARLLGKASPPFDVTGEIVGAIESIRDVTNRRKMEAALQTSEENFRNPGHPGTGHDIRIAGRQSDICQ